MNPFLRPGILSLLLVCFVYPTPCPAQVPNLPGSDYYRYNKMKPEEGHAKEEGEEDEGETTTRSPRSNRLIIRLAVVAVLTVIGFAGKLIFGALSDSSSAPEDPGGFDQVKIKTRCTNCNKGYRVSVDKVGNTIKCSNCNEFFAIRDISN